MSRVVATVLALVLAWMMGVVQARRRGFCAYCHQMLGAVGPHSIGHWRECPVHPARVAVEALQAEVDMLRAARDGGR